ncbi:integrase [Vogesella sp. LIG4]|uniref:integrase n=1 Tax=Vogesella sp. LIG4 TaxID=1192162 RepID=UPI00081FAF3E|nr:integrase [Vogesella sp. LIG4]SCK11658.1 putative transposase [Vogesella sp. LIG4]
MTRTLMLHDKIAPPLNREAYLEVLDPKPRGGCIKVFDAEYRVERYIEVANVTSGIHNGSLTITRSGRPRFSHAAQAGDEALIARNGFIRSTMRSIQDIQRRRECSFLQAYREAEEDYRLLATPESPSFPTQSTIYRYREKALAGLPALRGDKNKGNRSSRYPKEVISIICTLAMQHYLQSHARWSLKRLTDAVNRQVAEGCPLMSCHPISSKFVKNTITRFVTSDPEHDRMLPSDAIAGKSTARKRLRIEMPFERVEQDALHLPFVVETASGVTSQVYLVHAIDCCTGYPLGWQLVVGAPVDADTLACVEMYMSPRKAALFQQMKIDHDKNVCGTPGLLVFDNGAENKGSRIKNLEKLGVDVLHCRARAGQEKPFIERLNRSLKEALEGLAGCTRFNGKDGQRDPIALGDSLITIEELERWIVRWYYEKWIHSPLQRLRWDVLLTSSIRGETPAARWQYFEDECCAIPLPPSRTEWLSALYEHTECRLSRKTGITILGHNYKGDDIPALVEKYGEHQLLKVLFNPDDFRHIYVYEGDELPLIILSYEHLRPETPAWSFKEAKEKFKKMKSSFKPASQAENFDRDMHDKVVADSLAPKRKKQSKYDRNRDTARKDKEAKATSRAARLPSPLPPPVPARSTRATTSPRVEVAAASLLSDDVMLLPVLSKESGGKLS